MEGMEIINSDVCENVMTQVKSFDYGKYSAKDVKAALEHESCTIEDFKALLSPAAEPFWSRSRKKQDLKQASTSATPYIFLLLCILQIIVKTTVFTAALTATTK